VQGLADVPAVDDQLAEEDPERGVGGDELAPWNRNQGGAAP
jgi:hypothetical protein